MGCGTGFDPAALRAGDIEGRVLNASAGGATVFVVGDPDRHARLESDGTFRLEGLAVGRHELLVSDAGGMASRLSAEVRPADVTYVDALVAPAGRLLVKVALDGGGSSEAAAATVEGTALSALAAADGTVALGPLPDGCYAVSVSGKGFSGKRLDSCLSDASDTQVEVALPVDEKAAQKGCAAAGCKDGRVCDVQDGRCYDCLTGADCASGLSCVNRTCSGTLAACATCSDDADCGADAKCDDFEVAGGEAEKFCSRKTGCKANTDCPYGTVCDEGRCRLDPLHVSRCGAEKTLGSRCHSDSDCRALGLVEGFCFDSLVCTVRNCHVDSRCPGTLVCYGTGSNSSYCGVRRN